MSLTVPFAPLSGFGHGTCHILKVKLRVPFSPLLLWRLLSLDPFSCRLLALPLLFRLAWLAASAILCVWLFGLRVCLHHTHTWCPWGPEEGRQILWNLTYR